MKTKYDLAFSMGFSCGGTMALRRAGLQFVSYPLDWIGAPGIMAGIDMIRTRFANWLRKEDLEFFGVRGGSFQMNIYRNRRTGYGFPHDFSRFRRFGEAYSDVERKYARRIARFMDDLTKATRVLVAYIERPIDERLADEKIAEARQALCEACPGKEVDLVYFYRAPSESVGKVEKPSPGVTTVGCEYAQWEKGEISHAIDVTAIARYLGETAELACRPTASEEARYEAEKRKLKKAKTGTGLDRLKYRLYRALEKELIEKGLVPRDFPLWFY